MSLQIRRIQSGVRFLQLISMFNFVFNTPFLYNHITYFHYNFLVDDTIGLVEKLKSPRIIKTHLSWQMLPAKLISNNNAKVNKLTLLRILNCLILIKRKEKSIVYWNLSQITFQYFRLSMLHVTQEMHVFLITTIGKFWKVIMVDSKHLLSHS